MFSAIIVVRFLMKARLSFSTILCCVIDCNCFSSLSFRLLDQVEGRYPFIILSFVIRIVEAVGNASFLTASFAIIAKEFPNNVATTFVSTILSVISTHRETDGSRPP